VQEVYEDDDGDCSFSTRVWDADPEGVALAAVRDLIRVHCGGRPSRRDVVDRRPWERVVDDVTRRLNDEARSESKFHRPSAKLDRLFALLEPGEDPVLVKHPMPDPGSEHLYRENLPNVRCGTIASGRVVARHAAKRTQVKLLVRRRLQLRIDFDSTAVRLTFDCHSTAILGRCTAA